MVTETFNTMSGSSRGTMPYELSPAIQMYHSESYTLGDLKDETDQDEATSDHRLDFSEQFASLLPEMGQQNFASNDDGLGSKNSLFDTPINAAASFVGLENALSQGSKIVANKGITLNLMIAGRVGTGKTAFIDSLFGEPILDQHEKGRIVSSVGQISTQREKEEGVKIEVKNFIIESEGVHLRLNTVETSNFGNKVNNSFCWTPLVSYIDEQIRSYIFQEEQPNRGNLVDNRIHCCVYLLEPTGPYKTEEGSNDNTRKRRVLHPIDVITMKELSKKVNLLPVIAKSDILNENDLEIAKFRIAQLLESQGVEICKHLEGRAGYLNYLTPFGLVCSEAWRKGSSYDFITIQKFLLRKGLVSLIFGTQVYYEQCRRDMLRLRMQKGKELLESEGKGKGLKEKFLGADIQMLRNLNLNFNEDEYDQNGIYNNYCYQLFNKSYMDQIAVEWSTEFISKLLEFKRRFNEIMSMEDRKFQEWKGALLLKQSNFNKDIEALYKSIDIMKVHCQELEHDVLVGGGNLKENSTTLVGFHMKR